MSMPRGDEEGEGDFARSMAGCRSSMQYVREKAAEQGGEGGSNFTTCRGLVNPPNLKHGVKQDVLKWSTVILRTLEFGSHSITLLINP